VRSGRRNKSKGSGPFGVALSSSSLLRRSTGGKFSASDVEGIIMGTSAMASHGSREMPIWGPVFQSLAPDNSVVKLRVSNLIDYVKSIQTQ